MTNNCTNPQNTPIVSYNKGCRCERCVSGKKETYIKNKDKVSTRMKTYYAKNKREIIQKNSLRIQTQILEYKSTLSCHDCGYSEVPAILQFHHPKGSTSRNWRDGMKDHKNGDAVALCPTCHALRHYNKDRNKVLWRPTGN